MTPDNVVDLKSFVPAKDFALSRRFYLDLGFTENVGNDQAAELQPWAGQRIRECLLSDCTWRSAN